MNEILDSIIHQAKEASSDEDWAKIDSLISTLKNINPDEIGNETLTYVSDQNPQIRDAAASVLGSLDIKNPELLERATLSMINMAVTDEEIYPSGRAAVFLLKHKDDPQKSGEIGIALSKFKTKSHHRGWVSNLVTNIPDPELEKLLRSP